MNLVLILSSIVLAVAAVLLVVRMTIGPSILDRSVALDGIVAITVCAVALYAARTDTTYALPVLLVLSSVGFVGAVAIARYASRVDDVDAEEDDADDRADRADRGTTRGSRGGDTR